MTRYAPLALLTAMMATGLNAQQFLMFTGTFTKGSSKGIYVFRFDAKAGKLQSLGLAAETSNPSWILIHPNGKVLYAVNEDSDYQGLKSGAVTAFTIDHGTGKLAKINTVPSRGGGPCHLTTDRAAKMLYVANYGGGSVAAFPIKLDGSLGEATAFVQHSGTSVDKERQEGPHAHSVNLTPDGQRIVVADLGLDELLSYKRDLTPGTPPFTKTPAGAGPRHMVFARNGKFAYVANEMKSSVTTFALDGHAETLKEQATVSALPKNFSGESTAAEIVMHPNGRFVYSSNRGSDTIAVFAVDKAQGSLTPVDWTPTGGKTPRGFAIDPTGQWMVVGNQDSNTVAVFRVDGKTGKLTPTGQTLETGAPVCFAFLRAK